MLTEEILKADEALAGLAPEQLSAIATLSKNDEETVIGSKVGEIHGGYDTDVLNVTGIAKNQGEKSYDYVKRVLGDYKGKVEAGAGATEKLTEAQNEVTRLKAEMAKGGDAEIKAQLDKAKQDLTDLTGKYDADKSAWDTEKTQWQKDQETAKINKAFGKATEGLTFKAAYPEGVQKTLINAAKAQVLAEATPSEVDDVMVFRDKDGNIMRNPANRNSPFTAEELITAKLTDALEPAKKQTGTGTGDDKTPKIDVVDLTDLAGATTQLAADELIVTHLLQKGLVKGTGAFAEEHQKIRLDNGVDKMPVR